MLKYIIEGEESSQSLRDYLRNKLQLSSRFIKKLTSKRGYLLINGEAVTVRQIVQKGDLLHIRIPEEKRSNSILPERLPLRIMYEDDWLIILEKEAGMPSIPSQIYPTGTVANGLLAYYDEQKLPYTIHIVTRLDKDTSGLMLIAKHQYSHSLLSQMQKENKIVRNYVAIVEGSIEQDSGSIRRPIRRKQGSIIEREVAGDGQEAITHYQVLKRYDNYTYLTIRLETGRTHQIRVHFSSLGHPLLGDDLYGGSVDMLTRQALHCQQLKFNHPITKELLQFQTSLPEQWETLL